MDDADDATADATADADDAEYEDDDPEVSCRSLSGISRTISPVFHGDRIHANEVMMLLHARSLINPLVRKWREEEEEVLLLG